MLPRGQSQTGHCHRPATTGRCARRHVGLSCRALLGQSPPSSTAASCTPSSESESNRSPAARGPEHAAASERSSATLWALCVAGQIDSGAADPIWRTPLVASGLCADSITPPCLAPARGSARPSKRPIPSVARSKSESSSALTERAVLAGALHFDKLRLTTGQRPGHDDVHVDFGARRLLRTADPDRADPRCGPPITAARAQRSGSSAALIVPRACRRRMASASAT